MATTNKYVNYGRFLIDVLEQPQQINGATGEWVNSYNYQYISESLGYFNYKIITPNSSLTNKYISENRLLYPYFKFPDDPNQQSSMMGWDVHWDTSYTYVGVMNSGTKSIKITYGLYNYDKTVSTSSLTFTYTVPSLPGPNSTIEVFSPQSNVLYVYFTNGNYGVIDPTCWAYIHFRTSSAPYMDLHDMKVCFDHYEHGAHSTPVYVPSDYYYYPVKLTDYIYDIPHNIISINILWGIFTGSGNNFQLNMLLTSQLFNDNYTNNTIEFNGMLSAGYSTNYYDIIVKKEGFPASGSGGLGIREIEIKYEMPDLSIQTVSISFNSIPTTVSESRIWFFPEGRGSVIDSQYSGVGLSITMFALNMRSNPSCSINTWSEYNESLGPRYRANIGIERIENA